MVALVCTLTACGVHYPMRTNRFLMPEAQGRLGSGQGTVAFTYAHDVELLERVGGSDTEADFDGRIPGLLMGPTVGLGERWDLYANIFVPFGSLAIGGKYQFVGEPRLRASAGNFSLAATVAPGIVPIHAESSSGKFDGLVWNIDTSLIAGYRPADKLLIYGGPFYTFHSVYGDRHDDGTLSGHAHQFGVNLGLRLEWKHFAIDVEGVWSDARWDDAHDSMATVGIALSGLWSTPSRASRD